MAQFRNDMTLQEARDKLRELVEHGHRCPCCTQFAKVYKRKVNSTMARGLIDIYRNAGIEWCHVRSLRSSSHAGDNREESKLRYWGLLEEETDRRGDGGRSGWWRVTPEGEEWVLNRSSVLKYALLYDGRCLGHRGELVTIKDALGEKFRYDDLMAGL